MAKQQSIKTSTNLDVRTERDKIMGIINNAKKELEVLEFGVNKEKKYLKNLKGDSDKQIKEIEKTKNKLAEAKGLLDEAKGLLKKGQEKLEALALKIEQDKKEASDRAENELKSATAKIKPIKSELESLDEAKIKKTEEFGKLSAINEDLKDSIESLKLDQELKASELSKTISDIAKGTIIAESLNPKKEELKKVNKKLVEANEKLSISIEKKSKAEKDTAIIKEESKKLEQEKEKTSTKLAEETKKITGLQKRENSINARNVELEKTEKRIKKMGDTLQRHFNNNDMSHIKVFK